MISYLVHYSYMLVHVWKLWVRRKQIVFSFLIYLSLSHFSPYNEHAQPLTWREMTDTQRGERPSRQVRPVTVGLGGDASLQVFSSREGSGPWAGVQKQGSGYRDGTAQALETGQGWSPEMQRGSEERPEPQGYIRGITGAPDQPKCHLIQSLWGLGQRKWLKCD